jgi:hypothetical protein
MRNAGAERELIMMRWGMPPPPKFGGAPITNIRNTKSVRVSPPFQAVKPARSTTLIAHAAIGRIVPRECGWAPEVVEILLAV